jgi:hypothetical protein
LKYRIKELFKFEIISIYEIISNLNFIEMNSYNNQELIKKFAKYKGKTTLESYLDWLHRISNKIASIVCTELIEHSRKTIKEYLEKMKKELIENGECDQTPV